MVRESPPTVEEPTADQSRDSGGAVHGGTFELWVADGPGVERRWRAKGDRFSVGLHPSNELVLKDPAVSRFHCEIFFADGEVVLRDLGSRNGSFVDGVRVKEAYLKPGALVRLGRAAIRFGPVPAAPAPALSEKTQFGRLVGTSPALRAAFATLERAANSAATILLDGETGTGKGAAALGLHQMSARKDRPFIVVDCGSIPAGLIESELFGSERGAFTGADAQRIGVFEAAAGGTIFLDEVGELPIEFQPKLLRALEERQVRRLGSTQSRPVDVRVIAATNRDLRAAVNDGSFRADLYYRLAVVRQRLPALREHLDDLPLVVGSLVTALGGTAEQREALCAPASIAALRRHPWPGNVRELRNHLERCLVLGHAVPVHDPDEAPDAISPFQDARKKALAEFERRYLDDLLTRHEGRVAEAAEAAGVSRVHFYRLLRRYGLLRS